MGRTFRRILLGLAAIAATLALGACAWLQHPQFGELPAGDRLAAMAKSPNYVDGEFRNLVPTPMFTGQQSRASVLLQQLFSDDRRLRPGVPLPSVRTDLRALDPGVDTVVWLGHSSFFVQLGGKRILIDPVFSIDAAPIAWANRAFEGTSLYAVEDMPAIDLLLITHDHWDHLDHPTVAALEPRVRNVVTPLGVGGYLQQWGYSAGKIREGDWNTSVQPEPGLTVHVLPARHFSGRLLTRNKTLWAAFALESGERRLFFGGDSGWGPHFADIGRRFDGFDLAVLDSGQYDPRWAHLHMNPEESARAALALKARALLPAHIGRFRLARHAWDEPFERAVAASAGQPFQLVTPMIGEPVRVGDRQQHFGRWWEGVD